MVAGPVPSQQRTSPSAVQTHLQPLHSNNYQRRSPRESSPHSSQRVRQSACWVTLHYSHKQHESHSNTDRCSNKYVESVRMHREGQEFVDRVEDAELYVRVVLAYGNAPTATSSSSSSHSSSRPQNTGGTPPVDVQHNGKSICRNYNGGRCQRENCQYAHVCMKCKGLHTQKDCTKSDESDLLTPSPNGSAVHCQHSLFQIPHVPSPHHHHHQQRQRNCADNVVASRTHTLSRSALPVLSSSSSTRDGDTAVSPLRTLKIPDDAAQCRELVTPSPHVSTRMHGNARWLTAIILTRRPQSHSYSIFVVVSTLVSAETEMSALHLHQISNPHANTRHSADTH